MTKRFVHLALLRHRKTILALAMVAGMLSSACLIAQKTYAADGAAITASLLYTKDRLLSEKQRLYAMRQKVLASWSDWDYVLRQTEAAMRGNPEYNKYLSDQKYRALDELSANERSRANIENAIKRIDSALAQVDSDLRGYMAYRSILY